MVPTRTVSFNIKSLQVSYNLYLCDPHDSYNHSDFFLCSISRMFFLIETNSVTRGAWCTLNISAPRCILYTLHRFIPSVLMQKITSWVENKVYLHPSVHRLIQHLSHFVVMATLNIHKYLQNKTKQKKNHPPSTTVHSHHNLSVNVCASDSFKEL